ncbi:hypothetical protein Sru01_59320 [Sphaerisporangium rufum]|uniref:Uncharacterized protein n=1 Tax=Sphaerisporangium rufum TaxID=1381558 RepID=A0A919RA28_9ACTN|nr:hypothetical protein [Sphaerisporangium rufum]GII80950.1 hypothetical protein Sru01_59320 [Sphaerisporangium rufum]
MVTRGLNWTAVALVGVFSLLWLGVVVFAATSTPGWLRAGQALASIALFGWALRRSMSLVRSAI